MEVLQFFIPKRSIDSLPDVGWWYKCLFADYPYLFFSPEGRKSLCLHYVCLYFLCHLWFWAAHPFQRICLHTTLWYFLSHTSGLQQSWADISVPGSSPFHAPVLINRSLYLRRCFATDSTDSEPLRATIHLSRSNFIYSSCCKQVLKGNTLFVNVLFTDHSTLRLPP